MTQNGPLWRVRLFDGPALESSSGEVVAHFRSRKVGSLLAYLALRIGKRCPREEIACALWPDEVDEQALSNRFRFTLASLRKQLEPSGIPFGSVLDASIPGCIRLSELTVSCDVTDFDRAYSTCNHAESKRLMRGALMPGWYEEWLRDAQIHYELLAQELSCERSDDCQSSPTLERPSGLGHQLPLYLTRFFGREDDIELALAAIKLSRLVTLTGPGGIGKTRLAVETARRFDEPSTFVSLAALNDPNRICETTLTSLGITTSRDIPTPQHLASVLTERHVSLLILDNAEHLVQAVAEFVVNILAEVPQLRLLVTSRHRLELPGENVLLVQPLGAPADTSDLAKLASHPSVALFLDRAKGVRPDFTLQPRVSEAILNICQRLEGIPLALELAAVRVTAQSPSQIAEAISANLIDLKSRQRGLSERHRSLRAAVQGSFDLLERDLQDFFGKLSVFEGGWTAAAAEAISESGRTQDFLEELVVRSLVLVETVQETGPPRYTFLETIRQFAAEQLSETALQACILLHTRYFVTLAAQATEDDIRTFISLDREQENLIRAFSRVQDLDSELQWQGLAGALEHAFVRGRHRIALRWIDDFSSRFDSITDERTRVRVAYAACQILPDVGRLDQAQALARRMEIDATAAGDAVGAVYADVVTGYVAEFTGNLELALSKHLGALETARSLGNRHLLESCLSHASGTLHDAACLEPLDSEQRKQMLELSESFAQELSDLVPIYSRRRPLGPLLLGTALYYQGRKHEALESYTTALKRAIEVGTTTEMMFACVYASEIKFNFGAHDQAATLFGLFQALQEKMGYNLDRAQYIRPTWITRLDASLSDALGIERYQAKLEFAKSSHPTEIVSQSLTLG